jgi:hypothetical protein
MCGAEINAEKVCDKFAIKLRQCCVSPRTHSLASIAFNLTVFEWKEDPMGALVTICPATGQPIETGIDTDQASIEATPQFATEFDCPHCGRTHRVAKQDFYVCELVDGVVRYMRAA